MTAPEKNMTALGEYTKASEHSADQIIRAYSTSFGAATRLLGVRHRTHVRNIYALVRVADELVDGVAAEAGLSPVEQLRRLDALEHEVSAAIEHGYSSNPIVHAFANSARLTGIDATLTAPFFASMRMDLQPELLTEPASHRDAAAGQPRITHFNQAAHTDYVYGSAEVVGLMCLRVFVRDEQLTTEQMHQLEQGAQSLGAAFQNVNFLRDLADDTERLARNYLSGGEPFTPALQAHWIRIIRTQLSDAEAAIPLLPSDARAAVDCARRLFARLSDKLARTPTDELLKCRVRVANPTKLLLAAQSLLSSQRRLPA